MNVDLLRHQQRWKDGLQELRAGFATLEAQVLTGDVLDGMCRRCFA